MTDQRAKGSGRAGSMSRRRKRRWRLGYWGPSLSDLMPRVWRGTDQWHNPAVSVNIPLLGAFHLWFDDWRDDSEGHYNVKYAKTCPECADILNESVFGADADVSYWRAVRRWFNPLRPDDGVAP